MVTDKDKMAIQAITSKYQATRVLLFGSSISDSGENNDIDIAVEGVAEKHFFAFYGELMLALSKAVDVVDLSAKSKFNDLVIKEGIPLDA